MKQITKKKVFKTGGNIPEGDTKGQAFWEQVLLQKQKELSPDNPNMKFDPIKYAKKQEQAGKAFEMLGKYYPESAVYKAQLEVAKKAGENVGKTGVRKALLGFAMGGSITGGGEENKGKLPAGSVKLDVETPEQQAARLKLYGLPMPTAADSLAAYQNSLAVAKFYTDPKRNYIPPKTSGASAAKLSAEYDFSSLDRFKHEAKDQIDTANETLNDDKKYYNTASMRKVYKERTGFYPDFDKALEANKMYSPYQYSVQDRVGGAINPSAPAQYADFRIKPSYVADLVAGTRSDGTVDPGIYTVIYSYDPIDVKPWSMRTEAEKEYARNRLKMTGKDSTEPYASATITAKKPSTFGDITKLPTTKIDVKSSSTAPGIKTKPTGMNPSYPYFSTPTVNVEGSHDVYGYDPDARQWNLIDVVSPEEAKTIYNSIGQKDIKSMRETMKKITPSAKFDMGGAIGSAVGTALQFVPGVGPILSKIATPLLQAAGSAIDKSDAAPDKVAINSPVAKTINPFGNYKFGGPIFADGGSLDPKSVYDYLISKGLTKEHALGMLANIKSESGFNPGAVGDNGTSGGLFQHHATRFDALKKYAGDNWSSNWQKQIDYALTEKDTKNYLAQSFATPEEATTWFTKNWERPSNADVKAAKRVKNLQHFNFEAETPVDTLAPMITDVNPTVATESTGTTLQAYQTYSATNGAATVNRFNKKRYGGPINPNMVITSGGKFEDLGSDILYAKGKSHEEGGIKIDTKGLQGFDGLANVEVEHGELVSKEGYVIPADKTKPFLPMLKQLADRKDSVSDNTRKLIFSDLAKQTEADLIAKGKSSMAKFSGGGLALAQTLGNVSRTIIQPELDQQMAKFPATGAVDTNISSSGISGLTGLVSSGFDSYLSKNTGDYTTMPQHDPNSSAGTSSFKTPLGDIAQLVGMGVTTAYNLGRGLFDKAEQYTPDYNEYEDQYANLKQSINLEPMRNAARQQFATGQRQINGMSASAGNRLGNIQNLYGNFNQNMNEIEMKSQELNNKYAAEQSSRMYSVGAARQAARAATNEANWANMVAKDQYLSEGISNLSQGLTEFGKQRNSQASNELGVRILNDAFPDYYWNTDIINNIVSGQKPSWMTQDDFAKAKLLLYKKGYNVKLD